jgi:DNA-binding MarR family transcriptional regulator
VNSALAGRLRDVVAATDAYRQTTARLLGLGVPETTIVVHLLHEGPQRPSVLARRVGVTPASVTAQLDRLELAGHVVRQANPRDRRSVLVALTPQGHALVSRLFAVFAGDVARGAGDLDALTELELDRILDGVARHLARRAVDEPAMARDLGLSPTR